MGEKPSEFRQGVLDTSNVPTVVIEPDRFPDQNVLKELAKIMANENFTHDDFNHGRVPPTHPIWSLVEKVGSMVRDQYAEQGISVPSGQDNRQLGEGVAKSLTQGPHADRVSDQLCIVTRPPLQLDVEPLQKLLPTSNFNRLAGRHEGGHCAQNFDPIGISSNAYDLLIESDADARMLRKSLTENSLDERQRILDTRVMDYLSIRHNTNGKIGHATGFMVDTEGTLHPPSNKEARYLVELRSLMIDVVAQQMKIEPNAAEELLDNDRRSFAAHLREAMKNPDNPGSKDETFKKLATRGAEAMERTADAASPAPARTGTISMTPLQSLEFKAPPADEPHMDTAQHPHVHERQRPASPSRTL